MYKISIIVPVYNVEKTLDAAFESIKNQSFGFENLEVIFIDDKSTDNSGKLIKKYASEYENVKAIFLDENSCFAGRPRNIGIENASSDYLMFLDPDDIFLENACEILYKNITANDLQIVSGNYLITRNDETVLNSWNVINLNENEFIEINLIDENPNLLLPTPSVWSKIFKKELILKNDINFLVGVPAQDLVFVNEALIKAEGIKFINVPVAEYIPREKESTTSKRNKSTLAGFIKSYSALYKILEEYDESYTWLSPRNLYFWFKQLSLSDLVISDKIDLLKYGEFLLNEFIKSDKISPPEYLNNFLSFIAKKDYLNAIKTLESLDVYYDDNKLVEKIKDRDVFLLFYSLDLKIGGLAKAVFDKANILDDHGYNVTLLNVDDLKDFNYIISYFKENGYLNESIDFINIYKYYSTKNTFNENVDLERLDNDLIEKENYIDNHLAQIKYYDDDILILEELYTKDRFKFLSKEYSNKIRITLNDRELNGKIVFNSIQEFQNHFVNEILTKCLEKPFLINENSGVYPDFNEVDNSLAYKIGNLHTNPYLEPHHYGSNIRPDISILKKINDLNYLIVLTEALKNDLIKEFNFRNIEAIPNFVNDSELIGCEKNLNKISIFARLSHEKNIEDAIKAFEIVVKERSDAVLEIFGRAIKPNELDEEKRLKAIVKDLDLEKNVIFKGHSENVSYEMRNSLATLFTSHFEGLGMVVLESMINETPVISYDIHYGPSDFIEHEKNGYLVEQYNVEKIAECILDCLNNPEKTIKMGKEARNKILHEINSEIIFLKWENVLKKAYLNSIDNINDDLSEELKKSEKMRIGLYRQNQKLYIDNKFLKRPSSKEGKIKKIVNKIRFK